MVVRPVGGGQRLVVSASVLAVLAVLPLLIPEMWVGFRLGLADTALSVIAPTEQPLSVRSPAGPWAIGLALAWFALAYWRRDFKWWEAALVVIGGTAALARLGNAWVDAMALVVPLARQLAVLRLGLVVMGGLAAIFVVGAVVMVAMTRPPELPAAATQAALSAAGDVATGQAAATQGTDGLGTVGQRMVLADWRWTGQLQQRLGPNRRVWAANGLQSESQDFWLDYLRVAQGHARWAEILRQKNVDLLVLDAAGQQRQMADLVRASADWQVTFDANGVLVAERR
jgi:hypothetical protein